MKLLTFIILTFISINSVLISESSFVSFNQKYDSIFKLKNDTNKLNLLFKRIDTETNFDNKLKLIDYYSNIAFELKLNKFIANSYFEYAKLYWITNRFGLAYENIMKAIDKYSIIGNQKGLANSYLILGNIYITINDTSNTIKYYNKSFEIYNKLKDTHHIAMYYGNMSALYCGYGNLEKAKYFSNMALSIYRLRNDKKGIWDNLGYLSSAYFENKDYYQALNYLFQALQVSKEDEQYSSFIHLSIGTVYFKIGDMKNADFYINKSLSFKNNNYYFEQAKPALETLTKYYKFKGDYKKAFYYIEKLDSVNLTIASSDLMRAQARFELNEQNKINKQKIDLAKKESEIQKMQKSNIILISTLVLVALLIILVLVYNQYRLKNKTSKQLAELNATKDKFFTIISHDLKTPISSLNNRAEVFSDYYTDFTESEKIEHVNALKVASSSVMKLLDNLLTWSRIQTEKLKANSEIFNLKEIVDNEIQNELESANKKYIKIQSTLSDEVEVYADIEMIKAVIRNLISNAIKYTNENGKITITVISENDLVKVSISDNGIGIKDSDKVKLFRLDVKHSTIGTSNEKGTGLGLNLCKEFVELNNGKIWFESNIGVGSTFSFTLPKVEEEIN